MLIKTELKQYLDIAKAISNLLYPFAEVIVHNIEEDQIEAIFNPISKREVGDSSYLDKKYLDLETISSNIIGPYEKQNYDGRKLKSISVIIKNKNDLAIGLLCINIDISVFYKYQNILDIFLSSYHQESITEKNKILFKDDLYEQINVFITQYCIDENLNIDNLSRMEKKQLILKLKHEGALSGKNASQYIARILGVSRATVYNYLKGEE